MNNVHIYKFWLAGFDNYNKEWIDELSILWNKCGFDVLQGTLGLIETGIVKVWYVQMV